LSARRPKIQPPMGRIRNPAANTPAVLSNCTGVVGGEKRRGKVDRAEGVDVEVEPFDQVAGGGTDNGEDAFAAFFAGVMRVVVIFSLSGNGYSRHTLQHMFRLDPCRAGLRAKPAPPSIRKPLSLTIFATSALSPLSR
jgi:hypothetical protein